MLLFYLLKWIFQVVNLKESLTFLCYIQNSWCLRYRLIQTEYAQDNCKAVSHVSYKFKDNYKDLVTEEDSWAYFS